MYNQLWTWISIRPTPFNWAVDDPIFALLHLALIFSTYFLKLIVLTMCKFSLSVRNNFTNDEHYFPKNFWSQIYVFVVMTSRPYPLYVHRTIKVDSILYQKFALWTYSHFRHEMSPLYLSWNILLTVLTYVCRHCNIQCF